MNLLPNPHGETGKVGLVVATTRLANTTAKKEAAIVSTGADSEVSVELSDGPSIESAGWTSEHKLR